MRRFFLPLLLLLFVCVATPMVAFAQSGLIDTVKDQIDAAGGDNGAGLPAPQAPQHIIVQIIQILLSLVGTIFLVLMVAAGYWRITAHGEAERIEKANTTMIAATVGLAVVFISYAVTLLIGKLIMGAVL